MKKSIKKLELKKEIISNLNKKSKQIKGGGASLCCPITTLPRTFSFLLFCGSGASQQGGTKCCDTYDAKCLEA